MGKPVTYRLSSGIAVVTIDNPPMNALSEQVKHSLEVVFEELNARIEEHGNINVALISENAFKNRAI